MAKKVMQTAKLENTTIDNELDFGLHIKLMENQDNMP